MLLFCSPCLPVHIPLKENSPPPPTPSPWRKGIANILGEMGLWAMDSFGKFSLAAHPVPGPADRTENRAELLPSHGGVRQQ